MKIIGFDFDRVLFRTDEFKEYLESKFPGFLDSYPDGVYEPEKHAKNMDAEIAEIYQALEKAGDFLYDDVGLLNSIEGFEIIIVSRGDPKFQRRKIEHSGVLEYIDGAEIVTDEKKDSTGIDFLVDDREKEVEESDIPGMVFDRDEHTMEDAIDAIKRQF